MKIEIGARLEVRRRHQVTLHGSVGIPSTLRHAEVGESAEVVGQNKTTDGRFICWVIRYDDGAKSYVGQRGLSDVKLGNSPPIEHWFNHLADPALVR